MFATDDVGDDDLSSPMVSVADVVGLYPASRASVAARETKSGDSWIVILDD